MEQFKRILGRPNIDLRNRDGLKFKAQGGGTDCKKTCDDIVFAYCNYKSEYAGYNFRGNGYAAFYQLALENSSQTELIFYDDNVDNALEYLDTSLELGYPIVAGIDHTHTELIKQKIKILMNSQQITS